MPTQNPCGTFAGQGWRLLENRVVNPLMYKLLRGVERAYLLVAQPTMFEVVVNMKTTIALGIKDSRFDPGSRRKGSPSWPGIVKSMCHLEAGYT